MSNFKARPTIYKGIEMRSRLEAGYAQWLDEVGFEWTYEPKAFASDDGQYLPDFAIENVRCSWLDGPRRVYVEVKPDAFFGQFADADEATDFYNRLAIILESEPEAVVIVDQPANLAFSWRSMDFEDAEWAIPHGRVMESLFGDGYTAGWVMWAEGVDRVPGLTCPLHRRRGPWHGEWWSGGRRSRP